MSPGPAPMVRVELTNDDAAAVLSALVGQLGAGTLAERMGLLSVVAQLRRQLEHQRVDLRDEPRIVHRVEVEHLRLTWRARCAGCGAAAYRRERAGAADWAVLHEADVEEVGG